MTVGLGVSVSLFTGLGGLDYGLEAAGFSTAVAIESDEDCCHTLQRSRRWEVLHRKIEGVTAREVLSVASLPAGSVTVLAAGPPCQPFSKSANWAKGAPGGLADPRAGTLTEMMRLIEGLLPAVVLVENVPGFAGPNGAVSYLRERFALINKREGTSYAISTAILNAADYGVPQVRRRFFLVAHREGQEFIFPRPTHGPNGNTPWVTAWDAIGEIPPDPEFEEDLRVRGRWAALLPSIPEGENYLWHTNRGGGMPLFGWRTRYWSFLLKLSRARPSWTLSATPSQNAGPFHWKNRLLSTAEMMRLQTLPNEVAVVGTRASRQRQIGNAVPSLLTEVIGRAIGRDLLGAGPNGGRLKHSVPSKGISVDPEAPAPVPRHYYNLKGQHLPHPGPGQGPRARSQTV